MMSGRGIPPPPPPPPRHPSVAANNDVGSLCPPPQQTSSPYHHVRNQNQQPQMPCQYHPNSSYQMQQSYSYNNGHYQQSQLNVGGSQYAYQNQHHPITQHQYSYAGYTSNYASVPPPPPPPPSPPPSPPKHPMSSTNIAKHNSTISSNNDRQNQRQSSTQHAKVEKQKKVNPKMAQKYSGQGLKTITISGPGIRSQKFKICVGNHPDDIKKWIEERRKRFPRSTTKNNSGSSERANNEIMTKRSREDDTQDEGRKEQKKQCKEAAGEKVASLSNLLAGYGSSSSLSDNESAVTKVEQVGVDANIEIALKSAPAEGGASKQSQPMRICKYYQRGKCRHGESCKFLHSEKSSSLAINDDQRQKKRQSQSARDKARNDHERELQVLGLANPSHGSRHNSSGGKTITNSSLLLKLLQRDKERERRLSLQLLRYIVDCDYFQSQTKEPKDKQSE